MLEGAQPAKKILIVDDEIEYIDAYIQALQDEEYKVTTERTVGGALELLRRETFDLIILDMLMPPHQEQQKNIDSLDLRTTGVLLHHVIREDLKIRTVPIIFVTAVREEKLRDQVRTLEERYFHQRPLFLTKPVSLRTLIATVQKILGE